MYLLSSFYRWIELYREKRREKIALQLRFVSFVVLARITPIFGMYININKLDKAFNTIHIRTSFLSNHILPSFVFKCLILSKPIDQHAIKLACTLLCILCTYQYFSIFQARSIYKKRRGTKKSRKEKWVCNRICFRFSSVLFTINIIHGQHMRLEHLVIK